VFVNPVEERNPGEDALIARLRRLVEGSDLSFYKIASRVGTSGTILSMWLAGSAKARAEELDRIEKFLNAE
jgi:DNA transposition AAA+ family ATPase